MGNKKENKKNKNNRKQKSENSSKKTSLLSNDNLIYVLLAIVFILLFLFLIIWLIKDSKEKSNFTGYEVNIHVNFTENWIFNKYDVKLYSGKQSKILTHGTDSDIIFYLEQGTQTLTFESQKDTSIRNDITINVTGNMEIGYEISCYSDRIQIKDLYINSDKEVAENEVKLTANKSDLTYKNYKDVIQELKNLGFTNIIEKPLYDIVLGFTTEGEVQDVTIDGSDDYINGTVFDKDVEVVVSYHLKQDNDPSRLKAPYDTDSAQNLNYEEVMQKFKDVGFTNITTDIYYNSDANQDGKISSIRIDGYNVDKNSTYKSDANVKISYYKYQPQQSSEPDIYDAREKFEEYGKKQYKYGFKCHWIKELYNSAERNDGSYYFKVGVTITNVYGTKYNAIAEGIVNKNGDNLAVTYFNIIE